MYCYIFLQMQYSHSAITEKALNILTTLATHSSFVDHERYTLNLILFTSLKQNKD